MNIEHKLEPIEHWIVDGKAYRLATESDVGRFVYRSDISIERAMEAKQERLASVWVNNELQFECRGFRWRYAYVQDDSLLTPPQPAEALTKPIDWTKPVRTKGKRPVRVLCTDGPGDQPVIGIVSGQIFTNTWALDGRFCDGGDDRLDLENIPQRIQVDVWVNVYPNGNYYTYRTREHADAYVDGRFACVKITIDCEEGEGL